MAEVELVAAAECALGHGQIPYCIEQIGLSFSVSSADTVDLRGETELLQLDVSEVLNDYFLQNGHHTKVVNKLNLSNSLPSLV